MAHNDKRSVATDALETLGNMIDDSAKRDAIHLAVEPCIASENLYPGQHVGMQDGKATTKAVKKLGIVDPFLNGFVPAGNKFWLIVYPRQITSLRHVWSHPDFTESNGDKLEVELSPLEQSKKWINEFADRIKQHPDSLMEAARDWATHGEYTYDNSENYKDHWDEFPEFWNHYETVTGVVVAEKEAFFTCSC